MRLTNRLLFHMLFSTILFVIVACKPGVPSDFLQPGELEDILYDLHIADGMAVTEGNYQDVAFRRMAYREAVLRKYNITEAVLDSSLTYYYRHTERLHEIYKNLAKRLDSEAVTLGASANELSQFGTITSQGDTATVWNYRQTAVLMPQAPYNTISFEVKADTAYHQGDKIILAFDGRFVYQDGSRNGLALLAVCFSNDSIATQILHLGADMHYNVQLSDEKRRGIKSVKGFIHLGRDNTNSQSLKLMTIDNMKLMRMHTDPEKEDDGKKQVSEQNVIGDVDRQPALQVAGNPDASVSLKPEVHDGDVPSHALPVSAGSHPVTPGKTPGPTAN